MNLKKSSFLQTLSQVPSQSWKCNQKIHSSFYIFVLTCVFLPVAVNAADVTQQLHHPIGQTRSRDARDEADSLFRIGELQLQQRNPSKTVESALAALEIYHRLSDLRAQGLTYDLLGKAYVELGRFKEAEDASRRRLAVARDTQDYRGQVFALNNIGSLLLQQGEDTAAEKTFIEAVDIANKFKIIEGQGLSLSNLGLATARLGDYNKAIKLYETALTFRRQIGDPIAEANTYNNLGEAYLAIGDYQNTIGTFGYAMRLAKMSRDTPKALSSAYRTNEFRAIDGLVAAHSAIGRNERAFELLTQRLALANKLQSPQEELKTFESYALYYEKQGNYQTARNFYERAIVLSRTLEDSQKEVLLIDRLTQMQSK